MLHSRHLIILYQISNYKVLAQVWGKYCESGIYCSPPKDCCEHGCCTSYPHAILPTQQTTSHIYNYFIHSNWYFWFLALFITLLTICILWCWRRRRDICPCRRREPNMDLDSAGSCYYPPHYSRCNSFIQPPPYTEVTTKPDLYPLVITYGDNNDKNTRNGYFMVHYFKNHILNPNTGSLSATSTGDSLNSSFICSATNEANTIIPPPYSYSGNFEEWRIEGSTTQRQALLRSASSMSCRQPQLSLCLSPTSGNQLDNDNSNQSSSTVAQYFDRGGSNITLDLNSPEARFGFRDTLISSPPQKTNFNIDDIDFDLIDYEISSIVDQASEFDNKGRISRTDVDFTKCCGSPPQPTSPTSLLQQGGSKIDNTHSENGRTKDLIVPMNLRPHKETKLRSFGSKIFSTSAPSTPSSNIVPSLIGLTQKNKHNSGTSSKLCILNKEESNPLLSECDEDVFEKTDLQF